MSARRFVVFLACLSTACGGTSAPVSQRSPAAERASAPPRLGSWTGKGSTTLGFTSESGSFLIGWKTRNEKTSQPGHFQLTLRSGISGRPLQLIADHRGDGAAAVEFGDDPRMYEFLVDSNGVEWSISVDETFSLTDP